MAAPPPAAEQSAATPDESAAAAAEGGAVKDAEALAPEFTKEEIKKALSMWDCPRGHQLAAIGGLSNPDPFDCSVCGAVCPANLSKQVCEECNPTYTVCTDCMSGNSAFFTDS